MQRTWRLGFLVCLACFGGCGVGEYNELLERTRRRLAYMDQENEMLAGPLRVPDAGAGISFRPPKGIALEPEGKPAEGAAVVYRFPWTESQMRIPPFEVLIALRSAMGGQSFEDQLKDYFSLKAGVIPQPANDKTYTNEADLPGRPASITYRCATLQSSEVPPGPMGSLPLPERCIYNYEIYMHEPTGVAIIFKQLDVAATKERWRVLPPPDQQPLTIFDDPKTKQRLDKLEKQQKTFSLASLGGRGAR